MSTQSTTSTSSTGAGTTRKGYDPGLIAAMFGVERQWMPDYSGVVLAGRPRLATCPSCPHFMPCETAVDCVEWTLCDAEQVEADFYRDAEREWRETRPTGYHLRQMFGVRVGRSGWGASREDKEAVRERADVLVILRSLGIDHRRVGDAANFRCPFHGDNRPSAAFSIKRKKWFCYPEGRGGDIFGFWMEINGCTFSEAVSAIGAL